MENTLTTDKQLVSIIQQTEWIDLSLGHKKLRLDIEESIKIACVEKISRSPIMVKGAFGIGKTATLHYMFHFAWTKLGVPAFLMSLEDIIIEIRQYLADNNLNKLPNKDVSKIIGSILYKQAEVLREKNFDDIKGGEIYFDKFDKGTLTEYLSGFKSARLHTSDNGKFIDEKLPLFDKQKIKEAITNNHRYLLLIDEFEAKYQELKGLIESSGGGMLRHFFDDVASISSTNYYCIIGNGPASGYELNQDLKDKSDSNAAEQRRLFVKQIQMPTVASLSKTFLKGYHKEHINFIWWLSRSRPGQIKKLKENLQSLDELKEHNFDSFIRENIIFKEPIDDTGEANVVFLKSEIFNDFEAPLQLHIKNSLICIGPRKISIKDESIKDENDKDILLDGKQLFSVSKEPINYEKIKDAIKKDFQKQESYKAIDAEKVSQYIDLVLESISDNSKKISFGYLDKSNIDKALVETFLHPLWSILYDMITIYEDENDKSIKNILDFLLSQNSIVDDYENIDRTFKNVYDLFDINQQREDEIHIQLNLKTIREAIEQPIGSPKLPYKSESLDVKIAEVDSIDNVFIWNKNKNEEIIIIPNYDNEELLGSYLETLKSYFKENWNMKKNYFGNGELITNVVYLEENDQINEFKKWFCFDDDKEKLPYKLRRLDVKYINSYQIHNSQRVSDFISSLTKIATVGLYERDIDQEKLKNYSDRDDEKIIRIDKIVDVILKSSWTESKQTRRTIEYYKDLLFVGGNSALNQISLISKVAYNKEIEKYISNIEEIQNYSYSLRLSDNSHLETVYSSISRRFISLSLAQNEEINTKFVDILNNIQGLKFYPEDEKEELSLIGYNYFVKKYKKDINRFIDDFHQSDKVTKGIRKFLELFSDYCEINKVSEFISLLSEESLLPNFYLKYLGVSTNKSYFFDGLFLNILSRKITDYDDFKRNLSSSLEDRKRSLRELNTDLLDVSENIKELAGIKDDFVDVNEIDKFYTTVIIPFFQFLEEDTSTSNLIIGDYIVNTIDRKIKTIKDFISDIKKIESSLEYYKDQIQRKQNTINSLYEGGDLKVKLFKNKYSTPRNGNYLYSRLFVESFKKIGGGDTYDKIFQEKYKPSEETFCIKNDDIKSFQSTLKISFENNISTMDEIISTLQEISDEVDTLIEVEEQISELIKI